MCGRADPCPSGTCWVSPAELQFRHSLQGQPCEEGPAAEVIRGGRKQKHRGTWVAPWQVECHSPQVGRVPQRLGQPSGGLCSQVLSRIKVQSWKREYVSMWAHKVMCTCKSPGCHAVLCWEKDKGPLRHPLASLLYGLRLPDGASPADKAGRQKAILL